jgi:hypothetical protein
VLLLLLLYAALYLQVSAELGGVSLSLSDDLGPVLIGELTGLAFNYTQVLFIRGRVPLMS